MLLILNACSSSLSLLGSLRVSLVVVQLLASILGNLGVLRGGPLLIPLLPLAKVFLFRGLIVAIFPPTALALATSWWRRRGTLSLCLLSRFFTQILGRELLILFDWLWIRWLRVRLLSLIPRTQLSGSFFKALANLKPPLRWCLWSNRGLVNWHLRDSTLTVTVSMATVTLHDLIFIIQI